MQLVPMLEVDENQMIKLVFKITENENTAK